MGVSRVLSQHKMTQQEQLTKQLRKQQKELKENSGVLTNQKTNFTVSSAHFRLDSVLMSLFQHLQMLLDMKVKCEQQESGGFSGAQDSRNRTGSAGEVFTSAHAEPMNYSDRRGNGGSNTMSMEKESYGESEYY